MDFSEVYTLPNFWVTFLTATDIIISLNETGIYLWIFTHIKIKPQALPTAELPSILTIIYLTEPSDILNEMISK